MGIFATLYRENGTNIPDEKIEEFKERLEVLHKGGYPRDGEEYNHIYTF